MALPEAKAEFVGTLLETICYGMYFVVSLELFRLLYVRLQEGRRTLYLLVTAVIIFSLITVHLVLQTNRVIHAFTGHMDVANAPVTFYETLSVQSRTAKTAIYMALTIVCDALFVYRVFAVYQRKYISIIVPSILFLVDIGFSVWVIWTITQISSEFHAVQGVNKRANYFYAVTLTLNLLCTAMISWKIWAIHRNVQQSAVAGVRFMGIMAVIIESAAGYSCVLIALITTSAIGSTGLWVIQDPMTPIIGMVFSAVMVRASREYHYDTFMATDCSVQTYRPPDPTTYSHCQETVSRNTGDIVTGQAVQVPVAARKSSSSYAGLIEKGHRTSEAEV